METERRGQETFVQPLFQDAYQRNLVKDILDASKIIEQIEYTLRGYKQNNEGTWVKIEGIKPLKEEGINKTISMLREHLPQNQTLANLEQQDILRMVKRVLKALIGLIHDDWENFTFEGDDCDDPNIALHDKIVVMIGNNIFANLTRAKDGAENKNLRTIYRLTDTGTMIEKTTEQQQKNFLSNLFSRKKQINREE